MTEKELARDAGKVVDSFEQELPALRPNFILSRHRCPFYNFALVKRGFVETADNGCGFGIKSAMRACLMHVIGDQVDWEKCPIKAKVLAKTGSDEIVIKGFGNFLFFPREFRPARREPWKGIPFVEWLKYVMDNATLRP